MNKSDRFPDLADVGRLKTLLAKLAAGLKSSLEAVPAGADAANSELTRSIKAGRLASKAARAHGLASLTRLSEVVTRCLAAVRAGAGEPGESEQEMLRSAGSFLSRAAQVEDSELVAWLARQQDGVERIATALEGDRSPVPSREILHDSKEPDVAPDPGPEPQDQTDAYSSLDLFDLFRSEVETQVQTLTESLLTLEGKPTAGDALDAAMRAAHSMKGAASVVQLDPIVQLAHAMEDCLVKAQSGAIRLKSDDLDVLLAGTDLISGLARLEASTLGPWLRDREALVDRLLAGLRAIEAGESTSTGTLDSLEVQKEVAVQKPTAPLGQQEVGITAEKLDRLIGLAGESLLEAGWLDSFADSLVDLKRQHEVLSDSLSAFEIPAGKPEDRGRVAELLEKTTTGLDACRNLLSQHLTRLQNSSLRAANLSNRMYRAVVATRMRPFDVCARGRRRQVRDLARDLGKKARLEVVGRDTEVDGDIVDKLDAPISHLLRNALDHGLEPSTERLKIGKSEVGKVTLEARHTAGKLVITVSDDGAGVDPDRLVAKVLEKNLATSEMVAAMSPEELLDFLFLPGFSTRETVSAVSGRGVGLDAVRSAVEEMGGTLRVVSSLGRGTTFSLNLPLTRSVMRTLLVEVNGEPFAIPLARIDHVLQIDMNDVEVVEARQYYSFEGANIGLVAAHQVLELGHHGSSGGDLSVVVISDQVNRYGLVVDRFLGEQDLVVRPIDKILGKVRDISAMAVSADGEPVHIIDVDDLVRSIDALITGRSLRRLEQTAEETRAGRVLVVDDSIIVRELQKQLLEIRGFEVDVAVDGMDGWNALRTDPYDLVITDIDMPRMNGFELVKEIKKDSTLRSIPVIIVSYKDREEDRLRGLEAGANYYLTKGSFHDETLVDAVVDLIGAPS